MKKDWLYLVLMCITVFISCNNDSSLNEEESIYNGVVELPDNDTYYLVSGCGKVEIKGGKFYLEPQEQVSTDSRPKLSPYFVENSAGDVVLMARDVTNSTNTLVIDYKSTAIALVIMHPLFTMIHEEELEEVKQIITGLDSYSALEQEVKSVVLSGGDLLSSSNTKVMVALERVFEQLQQMLDENHKYVEDASKTGSRTLRGFPIYDDKYFDWADYYSKELDPLDIYLNGTTLEMRVKGLAPAYNVTVWNAGDWGEMRPQNIIGEYKLPARDDYGVTDFFKYTANNWQYGEKVTLQLNSRRCYLFSFKASLGYVIGHIISFALDMVGGTDYLKKSIGLNIGDLTEYVYEGLVSYYSSYAVTQELSVSDWIGVAYSSIGSYLKDKVTLDNGKAPQAVALVQTIAKTTNVYFKAKAIANFGGRLLGWAQADKEMRLFTSIGD